MSAVKVPADVELEDRLAFGLTAKQLALLAGSRASAPTAPTCSSTRSRSRAGRARRAAARRRRRAGARARPPRRADRRPARARRRPLSARAQAAAARPRRPPLAAARRSPAQPRRAARHPGPARPPRAGSSSSPTAATACCSSAQRDELRAAKPDEQAAFVDRVRPLPQRAAPTRSRSPSAANRSTSPRTQTQLEDAADATARTGSQRAARDHAALPALRSRTSRAAARRRIVLVLALAANATPSSPTSRSPGSPPRRPSCSPAPTSRSAPSTASRRRRCSPRSLDPPGPPAGSHLEGVIHATSQAHRQTHQAATLTRSAGLLGPAALELHADRLRVGERWQRTFAVTGYPREVGYGWLARSCAPRYPSSTSRCTSSRSRPSSPHSGCRSSAPASSRPGGSKPNAAASPTSASPPPPRTPTSSPSRLARGESRLFRAGLYLSVSADNRGRARAAARAGPQRSAPRSSSAAPRPASGLSTAGSPRCRSASTGSGCGARSTARRSPPRSRSRPPNRRSNPTGCFYGLADSGAPVVFDRFAHDNYNSVILARSGAGKSYLAKLEALRLLYQGVQVFVVDPEDEYRRLCQAVGGAYLPLAGADAGHAQPARPPRREARRRSPSGSSSSPSWSSCSPAGSPAAELAALDRAARRHAAGITTTRHPHRQRRCSATSPPNSNSSGRGGKRLAERLSPYTTGSLSQLFNAPTSVQPDGELVCFSLRGLSDRLKPVALLLCLDTIWRRLEGPAQTLRARRRGLAADARTGRRELPLPTRQERAQTLVRPDDDHPGRRRPARLRTRAVDRQQRRQPGPAAPGAAGDRPRSARRSGSPTARHRYLLTCPRGSGLFIVGDNRFPLRVTRQPDRTSPGRPATRPSSPRPHPEQRTRGRRLSAPPPRPLHRRRARRRSRADHRRRDGDRRDPTRLPHPLPAGRGHLPRPPLAAARRDRQRSSPTTGPQPHPACARARTVPARKGRCSSSPPPSTSTPARSLPAA